ncbi:Plasmodium vivax Vir protein, putative [Plasmodium vivax]|uniref:Vir protein, putative n=1 Tax=Plasmodium vivax TaxID=5855 RepID=A0A1G4EDG4_PLAVI|nr:Plasmodium vivax Vir protein, putative [Plasmodium vivax]
MVTLSGESRFSIKELPSEKFYDWLDSYFISLSQYYSDCSSLNDNYKKNHGIYRLCAKVVKYIKSNPKIPSENHLKDHQCNLFNYWLYEQLDSYCKDGPHKPVQIFGNFHRVLSGFTYYPKDVTCKLDNSIPMIPDRQDRKKLYDYCVDYKTILENYKHSKEKCNEYHTYVKNKIELYNKYQAFCCSHDKSKSPDFFNENCKNYDPSVLLAQLSYLCQK